MTNSILAFETYQIVILGVVAALILAVIIISAIFSRGRGSTGDEAVLDSREDVNENAAAVMVLRAIADSKPEMLAKLDKLYDRLKYLTPSADEKVAVIDEKIKNALGDLKIELTKTRGDKGSGKANKFISDINLLIAERSVYTDK